MRYWKALILIGALGSASCGSDGPADTQPPLTITSLTADPDRDSAKVAVSVSTPATVRLAYVAFGQNDSSIIQQYVTASTNLVIRPLQYKKGYHIRATATAPQRVQAIKIIDFVSDAPVDPCYPRPSDVVPLVDVHFEHKITPAPNEAVVLSFVDGRNCDGTQFFPPPSTSNQILSLDGGYTFQRTFRVKPNRPSDGNGPSLTLRAALISTMGFVRWLGPDDITLNGTHPRRVTEEFPAPPTCADWVQCKPGRGVVFDLNAAGVIDP